MLVTIVIPNYNHSSYLNKRIQSILNQTYQDFELIILDDCSKDNSRKIIEQYRNHPKSSHIIFNNINSGSPFKQWEKGISLAKGEWIWIAESDDYCETTLLEKLVANTLQIENVVLSYCQSYEIDEQDNVLGNLSWSTAHLGEEHWKGDFLNKGLNEIESFLLFQNTIPNASAVLFKKNAYLHADKRYKEMKLCGDWMLWVQLLKQGNVAFKSEALNYFRSHSATTRVIDTFDKKKLRLEEEYTIALDINNFLRSSNNAAIIQRLKRIEKSYASCFTIKHIVQFILNPFLYKSKIPLISLLTNYLKLRISQ